MILLLSYLCSSEAMSLSQGRSETGTGKDPGPSNAASVGSQQPLEGGK